MCAGESWRPPADSNDTIGIFFSFLKKLGSTLRIFLRGGRLPLLYGIKVLLKQVLPLGFGRWTGISVFLMLNERFIPINSDLFVMTVYFIA